MQLMISVRDADEAEAALDGGCDLLDIKEPTLGSLGAASPEVWSDILVRWETIRAERTLAEPTQCSGVSVAWGELPDAESLLVGGGMSGWLESVVTRLRYVKVGLADQRDRHDTRERLRTLFRAIPPGPEIVLAVYADADRANAPQPDEVLSLALTLRSEGIPVAGLLVDTFDKRHGGLLDLWTLDRLRTFRDRVKVANFFCALGGSLAVTDVPTVATVSPEIVAFRTAATDGVRNGPVQRNRVDELRTALDQLSLDNISAKPARRFV